MKHTILEKRLMRRTNESHMSDRDLELSAEKTMYFHFTDKNEDNFMESESSELN